MKKELKTAHELARMIRDRMPNTVVHLEARSDPAYGWAPSVVSAAPEMTGEDQTIAEHIAAELRQTYDLKS